MVRDLPAHLSAAAPAAVAVLESVRRYLWHGNVGRALIFVEDFTDGFDLIADPPPEARKLRRYLEEFSRYIDNNADLIPNYAERYRYGEVVSTAFIGSTVNQVIAKRFAKKQPDAMDAARRPSPHVTANPGARRRSRQRLQTLARRNGRNLKMHSSWLPDDPQLFYAPLSVPASPIPAG